MRVPPNTVCVDPEPQGAIVNPYWSSVVTGLTPYVPGEQPNLANPVKLGQAVLFPDIPYSFYPVYCRLYGIQYKQLPLTETFEIRVDDYFTPNGGIVFPNPNAPTGRPLALSEIGPL